MHAPLGATMHAPLSNHACPPRATMHTHLGATMHAPPGSNHACPTPRATTHAPLLATTHAPSPLLTESQTGVKK